MALNAAKIVRRRPLVRGARRFVISRRVSQLLFVGLFLLMPVTGIFRIDVAQRSTVLFGGHYSLLLSLVVVLLLVFVPLGTFFILARKHGRLFCSWACPQGALNEATAKSHLKLWGRRKPWTTRRDRRYPQTAQRRARWWRVQGGDRWLSLARHLGRNVLLPPVAAFCMVSYLVAPDRILGALAGGEWLQLSSLAFFALSGILYADFWVLQDTTCRVCFFGYLQSVASYGQPTGVRRNPERASLCHGCSGCRDSCFAGVDPRRRSWDLVRGTELTFDDCVSCGDCLVACDDITSRRGIPLIMEMPPVVLHRIPLGTKEETTQKA